MRDQVIRCECTARMLRLASASPRRILLLRTLGLPFEVVPADVDESQTASPAAAKADAVARPGAVTLAADTEVVLDGSRLGKPRDDAHAASILSDLAGRSHEVRTELVVVSGSGARLAFAVRTRVTFRSLARRDIDRYVASGEPYDKAGAYAIQSEGRRLVERVEGCLANVTGLPLCHAYAALRRGGVVPAERPEVSCQRHFDFTCPVWRAARRQGRALRDDAEYASWSDDVSGAREAT